MRCPRCHSEVRNDFVFCTSCGYRFEQIPFQDQSLKKNSGQKNQSNTFLYVLLAVVLLLLIGTTVLLFTGGFESLFGGRSRKGSEPEAIAVTQAPDKSAYETPGATPVPTASPTPSPALEPEYLLPDSSSRYLTEADLSSLSHRELCLARNEIFARHGRMFDTPEIREYFEGKTWYHGTIQPSQFRESVLSDIERANINYIIEYENKYFGGSYY